MTRLVVLAFLILGVGVSRAEVTLPFGGPLPDGSSLNFNRLFLHEDNSPDLAEPKVLPDSLEHTFNLAHCVCSQFNPPDEPDNPNFHESTFAWQITVAPAVTPTDQPIQVWVGSECNTDNEQTRLAQCTQIATTDPVSVVAATNGTTVEIPIFNLMKPKSTDMGCPEAQGQGTTWLMVDTNRSNTIDMQDFSLSLAIDTDSQPPPLPTDFSAKGAENAINLSWKAPLNTTDTFYYQALCATTATGSAAKSNPPKPQYMTPRLLCDAPENIPLSASPVSTSGETTDPDAGIASPPPELAELNPAFICGQTSNPNASGLRIEGLENGTAYTVVLLAIDRFGNASGTFFTSPLTPVAATDFWEDLHDQGSDVQGGFCLLSQTYGDDNSLTNTLRSFRDNTLGDTAFGRWLVDVYYGTIGAIDLHGSLALRIVAGVLLLPLVAFALLWHLLTLPGLLALFALGFLVRKRRITRARLALAATVAGVLLLPTRAHAQTPYWDDQGIDGDDSQPLAIGDPERVKWHAGVRLGPYIPGIDAQLDMPRGGADGPYEQMFGGASVLPMLDLDRFFFRSFGQLGLGISVGYMGKKAHPWKLGSSPDDPKRPRALGDDNSFRLIPLSLNAIYRLTYLDDEFGIPIVPYAKAGLAYYVWWSTAPDGDFATACKSGGSDPMCDTTTAAGASLGFVGSIGLAIRAERIDAAAARSMRESGIEHAGFYAEYSVGKVDGFGSDKKLSVGDNTWFVGIDFEF
ncbi:MAG: hypothetical protein HOV81_18345 [Kofleriaceae bacterium]|nr:hypothetical protein [Kofleriaceae bacterium]